MKKINQLAFDYMKPFYKKHGAENVTEKSHETEEIATIEAKCKKCGSEKTILINK